MSTTSTTSTPSNTPMNGGATSPGGLASQHSSSSLSDSSSSNQPPVNVGPTVFPRQIPHNMSFSDLMAEEMAMSNQFSVDVDKLQETKQKFDYKNLRPGHFKKIRLLGRGDGMF